MRTGTEKSRVWKKTRQNCEHAVADTVRSCVHENLCLEEVS